MLRRIPLFISLTILGCLFYAATEITAQEPVLPAALPNADEGLEIFGERCANCHGPTALGDGELAANLPNPPAALASNDYLLTAVPSEMFHTITNGRISNGMPPFGPESSRPLSEQQRWNLIAAVYSMGHSAEYLASGRDAYLTSCTSCHALPENNSFDNINPLSEEDIAKAEESITSSESNALKIDSYTEFGDWVTTSHQQLVEEWQGISGHENLVAVDKLGRIVDYLRTSSYFWLSPEYKNAPIENGEVNGIVFNQSNGNVIAEGFPVNLRAFNEELNVTLDITTTVGIDGRYQFLLQDVSPNWYLVVGAVYNGLEFRSQFEQLSRGKPILDMELTVFDTSMDPDQIEMDQIHLIIEFLGEQMQVSELYLFANNADSVYIGRSGDPANGTIRLAVPEEASQPRFQRGMGSLDNFMPAPGIIAAGNNIWADTEPVYPGGGVLLAQYELPYQSGMLFAHPILHDTANVSLIMIDAGVTIVGGEWVLESTPEIEGQPFLSYLHPAVESDGIVEIKLEGRPTVTNELGNRLIVRNEPLELGLGIGALLLTAGGGYWLTRQGKRSLSKREQITEQLATMAALDEAFENGELSERAYRQQRDYLKAWLKDHWQQK